MRRIVAIVTRSELAKDERAYPPWEIPILKMVHKDQVRVTGESRCDQRVPEPQDEYVRLERRFGKDKETGVSRVAQVFGAGDLGIMNLAKAMEADLREQEELDAQRAREEQQKADAAAELERAQQEQQAANGDGAQSPPAGAGGSAPASQSDGAGEESAPRPQRSTRRGG